MKKSAMALLTLLAGLVMGGGVVTTAQAATWHSGMPAEFEGQWKKHAGYTMDIQKAVGMIVNHQKPSEFADVFQAHEGYFLTINHQRPIVKVNVPYAYKRTGKNTYMLKYKKENSNKIKVGYLKRYTKDMIGFKPQGSTTYHIYNSRKPVVNIGNNWLGR